MITQERENYRDAGTIDLEDIAAPLAAQPAHEIIEAPSPAEIVEGIAWAGCVTLFPAESGAGKTFVLLSIAAAVDADVAWHGREVLQGSVVYVPFEADAFPRRLRALRDVAGYRLENLYIIRATEPISPRVSRDGEERSIGEYRLTQALTTLRDDLAETGRPPIVLVIIDTARASMSGNEDASESVSSYLRAARRVVAVVPQAGMIIPHHTGWQDGDTARKRERGSSAWRGNVDGTIYLEAGEYDPSTGEASLKLHTVKVRDGEKLPPLHLIRRTVEIPGERDRRGQPVTSCIIERDRRTREDREAERLVEVEQEHAEFDRKALRVIYERPHLATSQDAIRAALGVRKSDLSAAVARQVSVGHLTPGRRGQAYTLTPEGLEWLNS